MTAVMPCHKEEQQRSKNDRPGQGEAVREREDLPNACRARETRLYTMRTRLYRIHASKRDKRRETREERQEKKDEARETRKERQDKRDKRR